MSRRADFTPQNNITFPGHHPSPINSIFVYPPRVVTTTFFPFVSSSNAQPPPPASPNYQPTRGRIFRPVNITLAW